MRIKHKLGGHKMKMIQDTTSAVGGHIRACKQCDLVEYMKWDAHGNYRIWFKIDPQMKHKKYKDTSEEDYNSYFGRD